MKKATNYPGDRNMGTNEQQTRQPTLMCFNIGLILIGYRTRKRGEVGEEEDEGRWSSFVPCDLPRSLASLPAPGAAR